jgi:glycosyltransferase involved in cell wall biosynthesis
MIDAGQKGAKRMTVQAGLNSYQRGLALAEAGRYQEALNCIQEHLRGAPGDVEALNDAGTILHCLGRHNDAIAYLVKARNLRPDSGEIIWNLAEAYIAAGLPGEAASLFDTMHRMGILNVDVMNRTATLLLDQGKKGQAIETLLKSFHLWPEQEVLRSILGVVRSKRPKVAILRTRGDQDDTLADAWTFVQERFQTEFLDEIDTRDVVTSMSRCDIAWFDGGGPPVVMASERPFAGKIVVSLRQADVCGDWVRQVRWENVDILVQIGSQAVESALVRHVPDIRTRTRLVMVPMSVNLDRYVLRQRPRGKDLACVGELSAAGNPGLLLQCMQKLRYIDAGHRLFFAGEFESPLLEQYVRHMVEALKLGDAVFFESRRDDVNAWLSDKHFIVSSGISESQTQGLLAGMATGLKPVLHNFPAAERLFPCECLFNISEEFCERILSSDYEPSRYRRFVQERYPMPEQLKQVNGILAQLETEIDLQPLCNSDNQSPRISGDRAPQGGEALVGGSLNAAHL